MEFPIIHFSPKKGWNGDPNGLVYHNGIYHLFFQYEPKKNKWTPNMHWGHATSTDLLHWTEQRVALGPDSLGAIYSGSAVIDKNNTAGFGDDTMVCIYTSAGGRTNTSWGKPFTQSIAYSYDDITFIKYINNPVLPEQITRNRDPKVFWHDETQQWVMILFMNDGDIKNYGLFTSPNLKEWTYVQEIKIGQTKECPDMFKLTCDEVTKWITMGTKGQYCIGEFDGKQYTTDGNMKKMSFGKYAYSSQTWNNTPDGRVIQIFRLGSDMISQMTIPMELKLIKNKSPDNFVVTCKPIEEYEKMLTKVHTLLNEQSITKLSMNSPADVFDIKITIPDRRMNIETNVGDIIYEPKTHELSFDSYSVVVPALCDSSGLKYIQMQLVFDRYSLEFFCNDGRMFIPFCLNNPINKITIQRQYVKYLKISST